MGTVTYSVDGQDYEGYFVSKKAEAPLVLLIHDWDGLTDYEVKRANMLAEMGYSVFAADLFGKVYARPRSKTSVNIPVSCIRTGRRCAPS